MKESFVFYRSFIDAIRTLPEGDQLILFNAIADFALDQKEPEMEGTIKGFWMLIRPNIEANNKRYENGKRGAEHGIKGGRPKKQETPRKPQGNPKETPKRKKITPDVDVDVDVDVNEEKKKIRFTPPTVEEVKNYFVEKGYSPEQGEKAFNYYSVANWKDRNGDQVKNWKQRMIANWFKPESKQSSKINGHYVNTGPVINEKAI
ncbi:hypothetical protein BA6E_12517 [Bacteroidales bacterium 6E]|nr:hypothetical protein BA6E_12517 [Bacteroidales bacterium 6E]